MTESIANKRKVSMLKRTIDKFRYHLVLQAIRNKLARIGFEFTPYYWVQEGTFQSPIPVIKGSISEYNLEFLKEDDMKSLSNNARGYSEEKVLLWIRAGKKCLALRHADEIAVFMWINLKKCDFQPVNIDLNEDEAYLTDMYTMEPYRARNLAPYLRYQSYDILKKMGRNKLYSVSEYFNSSALRYKQKLNSKNLKLVLFVRFFHKFKWSYTKRKNLIY